MIQLASLFMPKQTMPKQTMPKQDHYDKPFALTN